MNRTARMRAHAERSRRRDRFSLRFPATELNARRCIETVCRRLRAAGIDPIRAGEIQIALAEALNNVVEHAHAGAVDEPIRLLVSLTDSRVDICICDTGRPLPDERIPLGLVADLNVPMQDLPEGGFGWFLIRALTTEIRYDRCGASNHLSLRFKL